MSVLLEAAIEHLPTLIGQIDDRVVKCVENKRICCVFVHVSYLISLVKD
jgi:hypothetical protein